MLIYEQLRAITGVFDPYKELKRASTKKALALYPALKNKLEKSNDKLLTAIRIAIAGNVIDFGVNRNFNIETEIAKVHKNDFAIFDYDKFKDYLDKGTHKY